MEEAFGHWFAGFFAGEGCLLIPFDKRWSIYSCQATVRLRDDDSEILHEIHNRTGLGRILAVKGTGVSKPQCVWRVATRPDTLGLVNLFDRYPLRGRKNSDFVIWREAVHTWQGIKKYCSDWSAMAQYRDRLHINRRYASS